MTVVPDQQFVAKRFHGEDHLPERFKKQGSARAVGDLVSGILNPVIERRAGMTMDLIASWEEIVGSGHASLSRPEKLVWPAQVDEDDPFEAATLIVACESTHALFFQHDSAAIVERINSYFGFSAVQRLKILQKPVQNESAKGKAGKPDLQQQDRRRLQELLVDVDDDHLRGALEKMGRGVFSERS